MSAPKIISIFDRLDEIIARQMLKEGRGVGLLAPTRSIGIDDCPHDAVTKPDGRRARMVVVMPAELYDEYTRRIDECLE